MVKKDCQIHSGCAAKGRQQCITHRSMEEAAISAANAPQPPGPTESRCVDASFDFSVRDQSAGSRARNNRFEGTRRQPPGLSVLDQSEYAPAIIHLMSIQRRFQSLTHLLAPRSLPQQVHDDQVLSP